VVALDLPHSMYEGNISRDEWMARNISEIFGPASNKKMLVIVGNLHVLKKIAWENHIRDAHGFIRSFLNQSSPHLRVFSIAQCIDHSPHLCDFNRMFGTVNGAVAVDCDKGFSGFKLGIVSSVASKPTEVNELLDGIIIY